MKPLLLILGLLVVADSSAQSPALWGPSAAPYGDIPGWAATDPGQDLGGRAGAAWREAAPFERGGQVQEPQGWPAARPGPLGAPGPTGGGYSFGAGTWEGSEGYPAYGAWRGDGFRSEDGAAPRSPPPVWSADPREGLDGARFDGYRFRGDAALDRADGMFGGERSEFRFRPLSKRERRRIGDDRSWRPLDVDRSGEGRTGNLFDSMMPPARMQPSEPYHRPWR